MMTYSVTLTCRGCNAVLRYEDERPAWKTYDVRVEESDAVEKSAAFVTEHADYLLPEGHYFNNEYPDWVRDHPPYVTTRDNRFVLYTPPPHRYVDCPVCDNRIREPK